MTFPPNHVFLVCFFSPASLALRSLWTRCGTDISVPRLGARRQRFSETWTEGLPCNGKRQIEASLSGRIRQYGSFSFFLSPFACSVAKDSAASGRNRAPP